jgi:hypothetical protein
MIACACLVALGLLASPIQTPLPVDPEKQGWAVTCPFKTSVKLRFLVLLTGVDLPTRYHLFMKDGSRWLPTNSIEDLAGKVSLRSTLDALAFVRLITSLNLGRKEDTARNISYYEIFPQSNLTLQYYFGDVGKYKMLSQGEGAWLGVVSSNWFREQRLQLPTVTKEASGWKVSRYVLKRIAKGPCMPVILTEEVSRLGKYTVRSEKEVKLPQPPGGWRDLGPYL